jgi:hypothetical protein
MPNNYVEYHIVRDSVKTYKIQEGVQLQPRDIVTISGDDTVALTDGTKPPIGIVYAGTVSASSFNNGDYPVLDGTKGHVVSVILKGVGSVVWQKAGEAVNAGDFVKAGTDGKSVVKWVDGTDPESLKLGIAETSGATGTDIRVLLI